MKVIKRRIGGGKTYKLFKRAVKLLNRGDNVLFINPWSMNVANRQFNDFCKLLKKPHKKYVEQNKVVYDEHHNEIRFISYDYYKNDGHKFINPYIIIFDDIDALFDFCIDSVSETKL